MLVSHPRQYNNMCMVLLMNLCLVQPVIIMGILTVQPPTHHAMNQYLYYRGAY